MIKCNDKCGFLKTNIFGKKCKDVRKQVCEVCNPLRAINPNLEYACIGSVNGKNPPATTEDFLCKNISGEVLFNYYGIQKCGYKLTDTPDYQSWQLQTEQQEKSQASSQTTLRIVIAVAGGLIVAGFIWLLLPKSK